MRILVVEDHPELAAALKVGLGQQGFAVDLAHDGETGWRLAQSYPYEAIILDRMLPALEGAELCARLRDAGSAVGILMLTAKDTVDERVEGLAAGADDYLVKPFAFKELVARVRALTRRHAPGKSNRLAARDLVLDLELGTVVQAGVPLALSRKEFMLLALFLRRAGQVVTHTQLVESAWDADAEPSFDTVRTHVKNLRRKIEPAGAPPLLRTVHGLGYRLEA